MNAWPYPGDSPVARARRVAQAYRFALLERDPAACAELDQRMTGWGQTWVTPRPLLHDLDDWVGPADAADIANVDPAQLRVWRARGVITGRQRPDGSWTYRVGDVLDVISNPRTRNRKAAP